MNVGLDLDNTITTAPWLFAAMTKGLIANGHKVFIITYRDQELYDYTMKQLWRLGVIYTELYLPPNKEVDAADWKAQMAKDLQLDVHIDDDLRNLDKMPAHVQTFWAADSPNLSTCTHTIDAYEEFTRLDDHLGLPFGTIATVIKHHIPDRLPQVQEALAEYGIKLDDHGHLPKRFRKKWHKLLCDAGMSNIWLHDHGFQENSKIEEIQCV